MIRKFFKRLADKHKERTLAQRINEMRDGFRVKERGGKLWLLHNGVAFYEIPVIANADEIAHQIETARKAAVNYDSL